MGKLWKDVGDENIVEINNHFFINPLRTDKQLTTKTPQTNKPPHKPTQIKSQTSKHKNPPKNPQTPKNPPNHPPKIFRKYPKNLFKLLKKSSNNQKKNPKPPQTPINHPNPHKPSQTTTNPHKPPTNHSNHSLLHLTFGSTLTNLSLTLHRQ